MTTDCPWGTHETLTEDHGYRVKRLFVLPGHRTSLESHAWRAEAWTVVCGEAMATRGDEERQLIAGDHLSIPARIPHRLANVGKEPLIVIETQTGPCLTETDIIRLEDDYGRAKRSISRSPRFHLTLAGVFDGATGKIIPSGSGSGRIISHLPRPDAPLALSDVVVRRGPRGPYWTSTRKVAGMCDG